MTSDYRRCDRRVWTTRCGLMLWLGVCGPALLMTGCDAFNPAFLSLIDASGQYATLDNPSGHVAIVLVNNAEVGERVLTCLESADCGCVEGEICDALVLSDEEMRTLKPRVRLRVRVTLTDGSSQLIEFIDGSTNLVKPSFNVEALPDLNQNDLNTVVVRCDVARVEVVDPIEVFVPIAWNVYDFVEPTETVPGYWRVSREERAKFVPLQVDDVDADLRTVLRRNIGIRDAPAPMDDPACGSVVAVTLDGVLTVPFFQGEPGYDALDEESTASVGGRYEFRVSVQ